MSSKPKSQKRPLTEQDSRSKRKKRKLLISYGEVKNKPLWNEDDDIALLKGMVDYQLQKQSDPYNDIGEFLEFVKPFIHFDVQRKQLTDRLWKLKNKYVVKSNFDTSNSYQVELFELSKMIEAWGDGNMSVDGGKSSKVVKDKEGNVVSSDGENVEDDNVVVDDGKNSEVVKDKKGNVVSSDGEDVEEDNMDVDDGKSSEVVTDKEKGNVVSSDAEDVEDDNVVVDDGKSSKLVKDKKRKIVSSDGENVEDDNVVVDDVGGGKSLKVVKDKETGNVVSSDAGDDNVVVDDVGGGKSSKVVKDNETGNVVSSDAEDVEDDNVVVDDVNVGKSSKVVKDKNRKVVSSDGENIKEDHVVVDHVNGGKKKGKKRVKVVGNENVAREVRKEDVKDDNEVKDFTSLYPQLTKSLESEMPSCMQVKKNYLRDIISSMGRENANELEEEWAEFRLIEMELHTKKLDLTNKQIKLILDAIRR